MTRSGWETSTLTRGALVLPRSRACRRAGPGSGGGGGGRRAALPWGATGARAPAARPFGEGHLGHELRARPACVARDGADVHEGRLVLLDGAHELAEPLELAAGEAGAHLAGVAQLAVLVVADEQRAELRARAARRGEAADHELLLVRALQLQPVARATVHVAAVCALGDQALEALPAGFAVEALAVRVAVGHEPRGCF